MSYDLLKLTKQTYRDMKLRCDDPKRSGYQDYGGRGITYSESWKTFDRFVEDMGIKPSKEYSIDRIDVNGNYCKENCRWATKLQQANNTRVNHYIEYKGERKTLAEWARDFKISQRNLFSRIEILKWDTHRAFTEEVTPAERLVFNIEGADMDTKEVCEKYNISRNLLYSRINKGWDILKAITTPVDVRFQNGRSKEFLIIKGITKPIKEWRELNGIDYETFRCRVRKGWDVVKAVTTKKDMASSNPGPRKPYDRSKKS